MFYGIALFITLFIYSQQQCTTLQENVELYASKSENFRWRVDSFIKGNELNYTLNVTTTLLSYHSAFDLISEEDQVEIIEQMSRLKAYDRGSTGLWTNDFAFLQQSTKNNQYEIYNSERDINQMDSAPKFYQKLTVNDQNPNLLCYDLEYLNQEAWIVDCALLQTDSGMINYIYLVNKNDTSTSEIKKIEVPNHKGYKSVEGRKIQYYEQSQNYFGQKKEYQTKPSGMLLRGQTAYNSENGTFSNLDQDCIIDLLFVLEDGNIYDTNNSLTKEQISRDTKSFVNFTLIDFKVMSNGDVYILDAWKGIYVYRLSIDGFWSYVLTIQTISEQAYGFNVNNRILDDGKQLLQIAILYQMNIQIFIDEKEVKGYILPFIATHTSQIYLSQKYLIVINQNILYLYNIELPYLLYKQIIPSGQYIINPYAPDFIINNNKTTSRYELTDGYLTTQSDVVISLIIFELSATDGTNTCKSNIFYKVLSENDNQIYLLNYDPFPDTITYPATPFNIQDIASGPNLQYIVPDSTNVKAQIHKIWDLDLQDIKWFNAQDIGYVQILMGPYSQKNNNFFIFLQHFNKTVIYLNCFTINYNDHKCTCDKKDQIDLSIQLNRQNSQINWLYSDQKDITFSFLQSDYEIMIYSLQNGQFKKIGNITYEKVEINKIRSIITLKSSMFIIFNNKQIIDVVSSIYPYFYQYQIDKEVLNMLDYQCSWTPKRVFGNPYLRSEIIFIQTDDCVIIGYQKYHFTLIDYLQILIGIGVETEVVVGEKTFFIITHTPSLDVIREYNIENLYHIYLMKDQSLFNRYRLQTPLNVNYDFETGFLIIRAIDVVDDKTVFLIYKSNKLKHNSLLQVIKLNEKIIDGQIIETAIAGSNQVFFYYNDLKNQHITVMLKDTFMDLSPTNISDAYVNKMNAILEITNPYQLQNPLTLIHSINFLNTQTVVNVNQVVLNTINTTFEYIKNQQEINLINNGWYKGHIMNFSIKCEQCEQNLIAILNPINRGNENNQFDNQEFVAGCIFNGLIVYLSDQSLTFQENNDTLKFIYKLDQVKQCNSITTQGYHIFLSCLTMNQAKNLLLIVTCDLTTQSCKPVQSNPQPFISITNQVGKLLYIDGILFVLEVNTNNPLIFNGKLHVYQLSLITSWNLKNEKIFDNSYFNQESSVFYITDFDVVKFQLSDINYYKILIQTAKEKTFFVQAYLDYGVIKYNSRDFLNLAVALNENYAVLPNTIFLQIRVINSSCSINILSITCIVTTNNIAQYGVTFYYDVSDPLNKGSPIKSNIGVLFLLNQYGTFMAINKLEIGSGYAAVPYYNITHLLLAVYKLPDLTQTYIGNNKPEILTIIGGELISYEQPNTNFVLILQNDPIHKKVMFKIVKQPAMYSNVVYSLKTQYHMVLKYTIYDFPRIILHDGTKIKTQFVELIVKNDYSSDVGKFCITNKGDKPDPEIVHSRYFCNYFSNYFWLWILLGVLISILFLAALGFLTNKKYKKKRSDSVKASNKFLMHNLQQR